MVVVRSPPVLLGFTPDFVEKHTYRSYKSESCIRGHRSSKCAHYDRPMKRIPKAGRPLAKCSHLNGVDCSCREIWAVMVPLAPGMSCQRNGIGSLDWK